MTVVQLGGILGWQAIINLNESLCLMAYHMFQFSTSSMWNQCNFSTQLLYAASVLAFYWFLNKTVNFVQFCILQVSSHEVLAVNIDKKQDWEHMLFADTWFCTQTPKKKKKSYRFHVENTVWIRPWMCPHSVLTTLPKHFCFRQTDPTSFSLYYVWNSNLMLYLTEDPCYNHGHTLHDTLQYVMLGICNSLLIFRIINIHPSIFYTRSLQFRV